MIAPIAAVMIDQMKPPPVPMPISGKQPAGDHRADDAEHDVAGEPEAAAGDDLARQPAGDAADDDPDDQGNEPVAAFHCRFFHVLSLPWLARAGSTVGRR